MRSLARAITKALNANTEEQPEYTTPKSYRFPPEEQPYHEGWDGYKYTEDTPCPDTAEDDYCCFLARGKADISRAMSILNAIPEIGSDYHDEGITNAFNELDDVLHNWDCECERLKEEE